MRPLILFFAKKNLAFNLNSGYAIKPLRINLWTFLINR